MYLRVNQQFSVHHGMPPWYTSLLFGVWHQMAVSEPVARIFTYQQVISHTLQHKFCIESELQFSVCGTIPWVQQTSCNASRDYGSWDEPHHCVCDQARWTDCFVRDEGVGGHACPLGKLGWFQLLGQYQSCPLGSAGRLESFASRWSVKEIGSLVRMILFSFCLISTWSYFSDF